MRIDLKAVSPNSRGVRYAPGLPHTSGLRSGLLLAVAAVAWIGAGGLAACDPNAGAPGAACSTSDGCQAGTKCLYPIGAGCNASGHCGVASSECLPGAANLVLCSCDETPIDLSCISNSAELERPTATGPACSTDAAASDTGGNEAGSHDAGGSEVGAGE